MPLTQVSTGMIADAAVTPVKLSQPFTQATAVASTSGTSIDFTGIPSWAKRITVLLNGVSTSGTSFVQVQLGTSGGIVATGYISFSALVANANSTQATSATTGFHIQDSAASSTRNGNVTLFNVTGNNWVSSHTVGDSASTVCAFGSGNIALAGALTTIRITTVNGTDTFDAGSINILYE